MKGIQLLYVICILLSLQCVCLMAFIPPKFPLSPLLQVSGDDLREYAGDVLQVLEEATLPTTAGQLMAIVVGESTAGFAGGIMSRIVAIRLGDKLTDSSMSDGTTSGTFFGVRGLVGSLSAIVGIPRPIAVLLAGYIAFVFAESAKFAQRVSIDSKMSAIETNETNPFDYFNVNDEDYYDFATEVTVSATHPNEPARMITAPEVLQDVIKWVSYDLLLPDADALNVPLGDAFLYGMLSGMLGRSVYEVLERKANDQLGLLKTVSQAGIEGAALFCSYELTIDFFESFSSNPIIRDIFLTKVIDL